MRPCSPPAMASARRRPRGDPDRPRPQKPRQRPPMPPEAPGGRRKQPQASWREASPAREAGPRRTCLRPGHRQNPTGIIRSMSRRSPEPCRYGGTAPYPRGTDPGARRQTLCDTDRNGAGTRDSLTRDHRSATARYFLVETAFPRLIYEFCKGYRDLGRAVTSRLVRWLKSHFAALVSELAAGSEARQPREGPNGGRHRLSRVQRAAGRVHRFDCARPGTAGLVLAAQRLETPARYKSPQGGTEGSNLLPSRGESSELRSSNLQQTVPARAEHVEGVGFVDLRSSFKQKWMPDAFFVAGKSIEAT
jgi:hypothetical protein